MVENCSDGEQSALLNGNHIQQAYCVPDKMTVFSRLSRFGMTYAPLTEDRGEELCKWYREVFLARTSQPQEKVTDLTEQEAPCGTKWRGWLAKYDPDSCSWKTPQCSLLEEEQESLQTLPRWGMTRTGLLWEHPMLEPTINENESGFLEKLPTPQSTDYLEKKTSASWKAKGAVNFSLANPEIQAKWATPTVCGNYNRKGASKTSGDGLATQVGGKLNPMWVEWLMGWPLGWTDLKPLVMDKSHCAQPQHGES